MITYFSNAEWPDGAICQARAHNITKDSHNTESGAKAVCNMLERDGLGGEKEIFPIRTWVNFKGSIEN